MAGAPAPTRTEAGAAAQSAAASGMVVLEAAGRLQTKGPDFPFTLKFSTTSPFPIFILFFSFFLTNFPIIQATDMDASRQESGGMASSRPRRHLPARESPASAHVLRASSGSPLDTKKSLKLTVKASAPKLRQATASRGASSQADELPRNARSSRPKKPIVDESEMDEDEDEEEEEDEDEDAEGEDDEEGDEEDAEGEEDEEEEDEEMADADAEAESDDDPVSNAPGPARPVISRTGTASHPKVTVTPAPTPSRPMPVESKESLLASRSGLSPSATATSDEELSELEEEEGEGEDEEELDAEGEDEDAEGEDEDEEMAEGEEDASGSGSDEGGNGAGTPDVSKMTKRQRERLAGTVDDGAYLQLPMEPQIKKHLTAEEHAMRRAEMARRRKNLSEKRNEEEKRDTINRLLKKQAPKRRGKVSRQEEAEADGDPADPDELPDERPSKLFVRTVQNASGTRVGVPIEWEGKAAAAGIFDGASTSSGKDGNAKGGNSAVGSWGGPKIQVIEES